MKKAIIVIICFFCEIKNDAAVAKYDPRKRMTDEEVAQVTRNLAQIDSNRILSALKLARQIVDLEQQPVPVQPKVTIIGGTSWDVSGDPIKQEYAKKSSLVASKSIPLTTQAKTVSEPATLSWWQKLNPFGQSKNVQKTEDMKIENVEVLKQGHQNAWPKNQIIFNQAFGLTWGDLQNSEGANCGYHAFKNVILMMNALQIEDKIIRAQEIKKLNDPIVYGEFMKIWAPITNSYRNSGTERAKEILRLHGPINWLQGDEIDQLKNKFDDLKFLNLNINPKEIVIIEYVVGNKLPANENMLAPIRELAQKENGILGVVWTQNRGGHWIGFVVQKINGVKTLYYMNSIPAGIQGQDFSYIKYLFSLTVEQIDHLFDKNKEEQAFLNLNRLKDMFENKSSRDIPYNIDTFFTHTLISWKNYPFWSDEVKLRTRALLTKIKELVNENPQVLHGVDWKPFVSEFIDERDAYKKSIAQVEAKLTGF